MEGCQQTSTQNVKEHGEAVWAKVQELIAGNFNGFRLPEYFIENHHFIVNNLVDFDTLKKYNLFHDCGKPFCLEVDSEGKSHFPNHAEVSKQIWLEYFPKETQVAELIGLDMLFHTKNWREIEALNLPLNILCSLYITALGEIHANADMFGGIESVSFKIKWKKLEKSGKHLVEKIKKHIDAYSYIIVRRDLTDAQKLVQSSHAVWELAKQGYQHPSLVAVQVKSEAKLKKVMKDLVDLNIKFSIFREPLINNEITALVTEPLIGERREYLKKFMLV